MVMDNLIHTDKPNLIEDVFSYDQIPRITFDGKIYEEVDGKLIQFDPADLLTRDIHITDTTFRDGQQARPPYTVEQIVHIYSMLSKLGGPNGVIRQSEFFLYSAKVSGVGTSLSGDYGLDSSGERRLSSCQGDGAERDGDAYFLFRLPYL